MIDAREIQRRLLTRAAARRASPWTSVLCGVPLCFLAALILGSMFWFAALSLFRHNFGWIWFFLGFAVLTIPLLFRLELRTGGDYLGQVMAALDPAEPGPLDAAVLTGGLMTSQIISIGLLAADSKRVSAGFVEFFLFGPRRCIAGSRHLRDARRLRDISAARAAELVASLLGNERGVAVSRLKRDGETERDFVRVLVWLAYYGWIGVSEKMDRAYLYSESREALAG